MDGRLLAVGLAVALAGCGGLFAGGDTTTVTPVSVPENGPTYPPGLSSEGVVYGAALADAHGDRIADSSYTLTSTRTVRYANGSLRSELAVQVRVARNRSYHVTIETAGAEGPVLLGTPPASAEFWSDGSVYARALTRGSTTTYNTYRPPNSYVGTWRYWTQTVAFGGQGNYAQQTIAAVFASIPTRVAARTTVNGTTVYRIVGSGAESMEFAPSNVDAVRAVRLEATVTDDGLVRRLDLRYAATVDGVNLTVDRTVAYSGVGETTVGPPSWLDRALPDPVGANGTDTPTGTTAPPATDPAGTTATPATTAPTTTPTRTVTAEATANGTDALLSSGFGAMVKEGDVAAADRSPAVGFSGRQRSG